MHILKFDSEPAWAACVASLWRDRLRANPRLRLCLPAGHTPVRVFAAMIRSVEAGLASFREVEVFLLDEYGGLPPQDPGRCVQQLRRYLVNHVDLPPERFHYLRPEADDLEDECFNFDTKIGAGFDLALLGVGRNGHLGMNEPGTPVSQGTHRVELHPGTIEAAKRYLTHGQAPTWGVTVGLKQLLGSQEVWLLACGEAKAEVVQRTVRGEITPEVPASLLRQHPNSFLFVDAQAGAAL
jgi:glucosamine-6-phosphate deaminase